MIPLKITLKGFLCYREERTIALDPTSSLWMLSGHNGSGKSTIFDALTFALFGHHRGGGRGAGELINRNSDGLVVEFVFQLGTDTYRIRRTAKYSASGSITSTQQIYQGEPKGDGEFKWVAVPNTTNLRDGFQPWIRDRIGLNYETFTSSVLLLQGQAEKLLSSKPEERRQVLASIVDLERYEKLHESSVQKRKEADARVDSLRDRLAAVPDVTEDQIELVIAGIADAQQRKAAASEKLEGAQELVRKAQEWARFERGRVEARNRLEAANRYISDGPQIEQDARRLRELNVVLPQINNILEEKKRADDANKAKTLHDKERQKLTDDEDARTRKRDELAGQKQREANAIHQAEQDRQATQTELRVTTEQVTRLRQCETQEAELSRLQKQLAEVPADLDQQLTNTRRDLDTIDQVAKVLPLLNRFQVQRQELADALQAEKQAAENLAAVTAAGAKLKEDIETLKPHLEEAERQAERAAQALTRTETLLAQARDALNELDSLGESSRCRHCGSRLTPEHRGDERKRRQVDVKKADEELATARKNERAAQLLRTQRREQLQALEEQRLTARENYQEAKSRQTSARATVTRLNQELARLHGEIDSPYQERIGTVPVADWVATTFPTAADLSRFQTQAAQASGLRGRIRALEVQSQQRATLQGQASGLAGTVKQLQANLPADRAKLRQRHLELESREAELNRTLDARKREVVKLDAQVTKLDAEITTLRRDLAQLQTKLREMELHESHARDNIERIRTSLPESWREQVLSLRLSAWNSWEQERTRLVADGTEERERQLSDARANVTLLSQQFDRLEAQAADYPAECRQDAVALETAVLQARKVVKECEAVVSQADQQRLLLESRVRERQTVTEELTVAEGVQAETELLARLLGRDRLQLHLVRQAERRVVEYANVVLDRLSGGLLYLQLQGDSGDLAATRALDLVCINRQTDERPINVAFLSGSQRFRVAVSLALGIGQYASRQHRPLECVIIDEGFGCLDRQGRQVMIQELQNLRSCLRCILLVSHQEEFADAFPNGYHFQLVDGTTEVTRVQR